MRSFYLQPTLTALGAVLLAVLPTYGAEPQAVPDRPQVGTTLGKARTTAYKAQGVRAAAVGNAAVSSTTLRETLAKNVTIAANDYAAFEWGADLSGADKVGISLTTLGDPSSRLTKVRIGVAFAAPGDWYILSDVILGSSLYFLDHGGVTVPVYGPFMKLIVFNDGTTPVQITQLAAYAVAR
jgi:hypothetical protein